MSSQNDTITRAQLKYIQIDIHWIYKPKIRALTERFGPIGAYFLLLILLDMGGATDSEIDQDCINARGRDVSYDNTKCKEFIEYCLSKRIFKQGSRNDLITNTRIQADQEKVGSKQAKWRERKSEFRMSRRTNVGHSQDSEGEDKSRTLNMNMNIEYEYMNTENMKTESAGSRSIPNPSIETPAISKPAVRDIQVYPHGSRQVPSAAATDALINEMIKGSSCVKK